RIQRLRRALRVAARHEVAVVAGLAVARLRDRVAARRAVGAAGDLAGIAGLRRRIGWIAGLTGIDVVVAAADRHALRPTDAVGDDGAILVQAEECAAGGIARVDGTRVVVQAVAWIAGAHAGDADVVGRAGVRVHASHAAQRGMEAAGQRR